ncbi:hypothetical protein PG985_012603 [Apiospora marii]|uniref:uncharacterized protein n=1 Tax=Apiospora marii TaxID=335849 RepID=UPI003130D355
MRSATLIALAAAAAAGPAVAAQTPLPSTLFPSGTPKPSTLYPASTVAASIPYPASSTFSTSLVPRSSASAAAVACNETKTEAHVERRDDGGPPPGVGAGCYWICMFFLGADPKKCAGQCEGAV